MNLLVIDSKNAAKIYSEAGPELKKQIEKAFGKIINAKVTDRIKTFEDACIDQDIDIDQFSTSTLLDSADELAYKKAKIITKALNEGWVPDWNNSNERKWRPWFYLDSPGFRFFGSRYAYSGSYSAGGSRLCFKSEELCEYAAKQFIDIYRELYN